MIEEQGDALKLTDTTVTTGHDDGLSLEVDDERHFERDGSTKRERALKKKGEARAMDVMVGEG